jgi:hypothetical protein
VGVAVSVGVHVGGNVAADGASLVSVGDAAATSRGGGKGFRGMYGLMKIVR